MFVGDLRPRPLPIGLALDSSLEQKKKRKKFTCGPIACNTLSDTRPHTYGGARVYTLRTLILTHNRHPMIFKVAKTTHTHTHTRTYLWGENMLPVLMEAELRAAELRPAAEVLDDFWLSIWFWRCCCICCCTVLGEWPTGTVTGITLGGALLNGVYTQSQRVYISIV